MLSLLFASILIAAFPFSKASKLLPCRTIIGDEEWPNTQAWSSLNYSVGGRLIQTVPLATPCHGVLYDPSSCSRVQKNWHNPDFHEPSSSSIMSAVFSNRSCDPFGLSLGCSLGTYVSYSVEVEVPSDVVHAINFANTYNLRFVVRNTGHDYMGKSTGGSALAVWMHKLQQTMWIPVFYSSTYQGPAVKLGAGVTGGQINQEASERGYTVITGDCPSVGIAGGYLQGGGVGPLSTLHGLLADNVLSFEVITPDGQFLNASQSENADLFWALSGGGGGTYGIVWSVTVKVFPDTSVIGATLAFSTSQNVSSDLWWDGVAAYRRMTTRLTDKGGYSLALYTSGSFSMSPLMLFDSTNDQLSQIVGPMLQELESLGIPFNYTSELFPSYLDAHNSLFPTEIFDVQNTIVGGRLLARSLWDSEETFDALNQGIRSIIDDGSGAGAYDITVAPTLTNQNISVENAVLPQWRTTQAEFAFFLPWIDNGTYAQYQSQQNKLTDEYTKIMKQVSPNGGAYLNEADAFDPDWKTAFYGENYDRLLQIKNKYDPDGLLYGSTAVGGDQWQEINGRLCRVT